MCRIVQTRAGKHAHIIPITNLINTVIKLFSFVYFFSLNLARPLIQPELFFQLSSFGAEQRKSLKILHGFTDKVASFN
jgi:hypothetical protein